MLVSSLPVIGIIMLFWAYLQELGKAMTIRIAISVELLILILVFFGSLLLRATFK